MTDPADPPSPRWAQLKDEELLDLRIGELAVRVEGSDLAPCVAQLYD